MVAPARTTIRKAQSRAVFALSPARQDALDRACGRSRRAAHQPRPAEAAVIVILSTKTPGSLKIHA
jgi:hypothetical protein